MNVYRYLIDTDFLCIKNRFSFLIPGFYNEAVTEAFKYRINMFV